MGDVSDPAPSFDAGVCDALSICAQHLGLELGIVSRIEGDAYTVEHCISPEDTLTAGAQFALGDTYCALTLEANDIVAIDEVGSSEYAGHPCYSAFGLVSYIGCAFRVDDQVYGTVNFSSSERRAVAFGPAERALLKLAVTWVERTYALHRLTQERERTSAAFRTAFERSPDAIVIHRRGVILSMNEAAGRLVGVPREELFGRTLEEFIVEERERDVARQRIASLAAGKTPPEIHKLDIRGADGRIRTIESTGTPIELADGLAAVTIIRDVTERKEAELQLLQSERLATVGSLAAGVAHELNNPLAYVIANLDVVREELIAIIGGSPSQRLRDLVDAVVEAREGAERARRIVRTLRTFSRVEEETRARQDVRRLLEVAIAMTKNELRHRAELVREFSEDVPNVWADEARITQVFVNLLMNAAQAIAVGHAQDHYVKVRCRSDAAGWVEVVVEDSGGGITADNLLRIFDPFFTTKPPGEGLGLGLSVSFGIVEEFGGKLDAEPNPDRGTTFNLTLSLAQPEPDHVG